MKVIKIKIEKIKISGVPSIIYGEKSDSVFLFVHGKCGNKEEAEDFYKSIENKAWQVIGIDLGEHGERKGETNTFNPWRASEDLKKVFKYISLRFSKYSLRANSIGAWFCMMSLNDVKFDKCLFVSPITDMQKLILNMMKWSNVSESELENKGTIQTEFGEVLSWEYLNYVRTFPIKNWSIPTYVLYGENDNLTDRATISEFCEKYNSSLCVMKNGEHWFHTDEQVSFMNNWIKDIIK